MAEELKEFLLRAKEAMLDRECAWAARASEWAEPAGAIVSCRQRAIHMSATSAQDHSAHIYDSDIE